MIIRLLIAAIAIFLAIILIKRLRRRTKPDKPALKHNEFAETVSCKTCGLRLPKSEAIANDGEYFCCREHIKP